MYRGQPHRRSHGSLAAPAEQHAGASVVGLGGLARNAERRVDHQRHEPLRRVDVLGGLGRQERISDRHRRRLRRRAGLRHRAAEYAGAARSLLAAVPIHDAGKRRDGLPHAALGDGRRRLPELPAQPALAIYRQGDSQHRCGDGGRGAGGQRFAPRTHLIFLAVDRRHRRARLRGQVLRLPPGQQQGLPHGGIDRRRSRPLPHAGGAAHRD